MGAEHVVALASGGKDSFHSALHVAARGDVLSALCNLTPDNDISQDTDDEPNKDELNSFMFQTVGHDVVAAYVDALPSADLLAYATSACSPDMKMDDVVEELLKCSTNKFPLYRAQIQGESTNTSATYFPSPLPNSNNIGDEVEDLYGVLARIKTEIPTITAVSCGAILSNYQRVRVESVCERLGLKVLAPLWRMDQHHLLNEMIETKLHAIIVKVACLGLDSRDLGKPLATIYPKLTKLHNNFGCNVCGEGGEFETITLDSPLFIKRINIIQTETIDLSNDPSCQVSFLKIRKFETIPKFNMKNKTEVQQWLLQFREAISCIRARYSIYGFPVNKTPIALTIDDKIDDTVSESKVPYSTNVKDSFLVTNTNKIRGVFATVSNIISSTIKQRTSNVNSPVQSNHSIGVHRDHNTYQRPSTNVLSKRDSEDDVAQVSSTTLPDRYFSREDSTHSRQAIVVQSNGLDSPSLSTPDTNSARLNLHPSTPINLAHPGGVMQGWQGSLPFVTGGKYISLNGLTVSSLVGGPERYSGMSLEQETEILMTYLIAQLDRNARLYQDPVDRPRAAVVLGSNTSEYLPDPSVTAVARVVSMYVTLKDMDKFSEFNKVYRTFFGPDIANIYGDGAFPHVASNCSPPVRVCISTNLEAPSNIQIDCLAYMVPNSDINNEQINQKRHAIDFMHVQSLSYWAPANIGPYSQTSIIEATNDIFAAGQIGLDPFEMELPMMGGMTPNGIRCNVVSFIEKSAISAQEYEQFGSLSSSFTTPLLFKTICARINLLVELGTLYWETMTALNNFTQVIFGSLNSSESTVIPIGEPAGEINKRTIRNNAVRYIQFLRKLRGGSIMLSSSRLTAVRNAVIESAFDAKHNTLSRRTSVASFNSSTNPLEYDDGLVDELALAVIHEAMVDCFAPSSEVTIEHKEVESCLQLMFGASSSCAILPTNYDCGFIWKRGNISLDFDAIPELEDLLTEKSDGFNADVVSGWDKNELQDVYKAFVKVLLVEKRLPLAFATASSLPKNAFVEFCMSFTDTPRLSSNISSRLNGLSATDIVESYSSSGNIIVPVIEQTRAQVSFEDRLDLDGIGCLYGTVELTLHRGAPLTYTILIRLDTSDFFVNSSPKSQQRPESKQSTNSEGKYNNVSATSSGPQRTYLAISQLIGRQMDRIIHEFFMKYLLYNDSIVSSRIANISNDDENEDSKITKALNNGPWTNLTSDIKSTQTSTDSPFQHSSSPNMLRVGHGTATIDPEVFGMHNVQVMYRVRGTGGVSGAHIAAALQTPLEYASTIRVTCDNTDNNNTQSTVVALLPLSSAYIGVDDILAWKNVPGTVLAVISGRISGSW